MPRLPRSIAPTIAAAILTTPPDTDPARPAAPAWTAQAGPWETYWRGVASAADTPGYVLLAGSVGFGALARDMGLGLGHAMWLGIVFYALPAQVVLADQVGRGASVLAAALAVSLTAVRLMPMTVTLMPLLRDHKGRRWLELVAVHFVAVTAWIEGHRRLGAIPEHLRLPYFQGFGSAFVGFTVLGTLIGYFLAGQVPTAISAALLFFTPGYFMLSLMVTARARADQLAILLGVVLGPIFYIVAPGFDLLLAGLLGGSLAYASGRAK